MKHTGDILRDILAGIRRSPDDREKAQAEYDAWALAQKEQHEAKQKALWADHLRQCGAPDRAVEALSGPYRQTLAVQAAERWLKSDKGFLLLAGWTGCGKTAAACLAFREATRLASRLQEPLPEWDSWGALFLRFTALKRLSDFDQEDQALFAKACRVRVLVLDDVALAPGEELTPRIREYVEDLFEARDARGKRTAITTNLSVEKEGDKPSAIARCLGPRVVSRMARGLVVQDCGREDLRRQSAEVRA
jgi:DNA replication protein DnaC